MIFVIWCGIKNLTLLSDERIVPNQLARTRSENDPNDQRLSIQMRFRCLIMFSPLVCRSRCMIRTWKCAFARRTDLDKESINPSYGPQPHLEHFWFSLCFVVSGGLALVFKVSFFRSELSARRTQWSCDWWPPKRWKTYAQISSAESDRIRTENDPNDAFNAQMRFR